MGPQAAKACEERLFSSPKSPASGGGGTHWCSPHGLMATAMPRSEAANAVPFAGAISHTSVALLQAPCVQVHANFMTGSDKKRKKFKDNDLWDLSCIDTA